MQDSEPSFNASNGRISFATRRKLDTGDSSSDFVVRLDEDLAMSYAYSTSSSNRAFKHEEWGVWTLKVSDEGIRRSSLDIRELLRSDTIE